MVVLLENLGSKIGVSRKRRKESLFEKVTLLKANIEQAYALILDEEKVLLADDVSLQAQVDLLTRLCYNAEDMVIGFEIRDSLKAPAWLHQRNSIAVGALKKRRLLFMTTRLEKAIISLQRRLQINRLQTPSSLRHNKSFLPRHSKQVPLAGRDEDIMAIIKELTSQDEIKSLGVSIVGMNGVGKSALAQKILNDDFVIKSFQLILTASLSGPLNPEEISKQLLESYKESKYGAHCNYTSMYQHLHECQWLIALDNLSDVTYTEWSDFLSLFHGSSKGNFLITTINHNISVVTQTTRYFLHPLSDEYCRDVILSKAKPGMNGDRSLSAKIDILAKKCSGLPLVASFMGSQLHDEDNRRAMMDRDLWEVPEFQREILPTLASMYSMLKPHHLRKCFAYFSLFPHGYLYNMEDLIQLWIGEGFIQCREESSLERVGEDYFKNLVKWSILQPSTVDCDGKPGHYKIHEFTRKIAKLVASDICFCVDEESAYSSTMATNTRHLSLSCKKLERDFLKNIEKLKGLRTLLPLGPSTIHFRPFPSSLFKRLLYIRVLSFKHTDVVEVPKSISKLKLLRYLDISDTQIIRLPEKISKLHNLLILKLKNTTSLTELPEKFNKLIKLRYIDWDINDMRRLKSLPSSIGNLTSLQRLPLFEVCEKKGCSIIELRDMVYLQGSICITNLEKIKNKEEAAKAELSSKKSLEGIEFKWTCSNLNDISEDVLPALRPHESLRKLQITNYGGQEFPQWLGELHQLETVDLKGCSCKFLPALGHLPALKLLLIEDMRHVESLEDLFHKPTSSSYDEWFPALESLKLETLSELHQWTGLTATDLPRLHDLGIVDCPKLISLPSLEHLTSLNDLQIIKCAALDLLPELPSSLISFSISKCGLLVERCQPGAQYWSTVNHIPNLWIDDELIPTSSDPNIQVVDESIDLEGQPTSDKCSQLWAAPLLAEFPSHLEMMLHCLLFPKDYKFGKKRLIHLWSAAGFLKNKPMEDDGDSFFHFLLENRFIITPTNEDLSGTEIYQFNLTEFGSFFDKLGAVKHFDEKIENVSVVANRFAGYWDVSVTSGEIDQESFGLLREFSKLRSLLFLNGSVVTTVPSHIFSAFKFLRTLDLSCTGLKELPTSVRYAKELRYLDLSWTLIERLPDSIANLCELQSLKLEGCAHLFSLPKRMNQLIKLRHLDFDVLGQLTSMPERMGALVELQTLWAFIVDSVDDCNIKELKNMEHLSGKFCLSGLEHVMKLEDAEEAALINKGHVSQLELRWSNVYEKIEGCSYVEVLEGLKPHTCLEQLRIICFPGSEFPKWVGDHSYLNLVSIILYKCEDCEHLPTLSRLPKLENLEIIDMNGVTEIDDIRRFHKLHTLTIDGMHSLKKWSGLNGDNFPSIVNLSIKQCPELSSLILSSSPSENSQLSNDASNAASSLPCLHVKIVHCPVLASLPDRLLSSSLQTLIIEDCPLGDRYRERGEDRNKITSDDAKIWIFPDTQTSDEDIDTAKVDVSSDRVSNPILDEVNLENGILLDDQ